MYSIWKSLDILPTLNSRLIHCGRWHMPLGRYSTMVCDVMQVWVSKDMPAWPLVCVTHQSFDSIFHMHSYYEYALHTIWACADTTSTNLWLMLLTTRRFNIGVLNRLRVCSNHSHTMAMIQWIAICILDKRVSMYVLTMYTRIYYDLLYDWYYNRYLMLCY